MVTFFIGLGILVLGYLIYGRVMERLFEPDPARVTPAVKNNAVYEDRQALPHGKCMLLQLLHIVGIGPVVGVILGAKFGPVVFLIIPIGNIFAGAVHDYFSGMISMRNGAKSYLETSKKFLNKKFAFLSTIFMIVALFALSTSFTNVSTTLLNTSLKANGLISSDNLSYSFVFFVCVIFLYYTFSTFFPINSFVSKMSNLFGAVLIIATVSILFFGLDYIKQLPELDIENLWSNFTQHPQGQPILPMLFVTIACGIISGFHGSQNPITAGIESNEKNGRQTFFGMMVVEGFLAMIWAAIGVIGYKLHPNLLSVSNGPVIISEIVRGIVSSEILSELILFSVVILAVTTADAALRTLRLLISDIFRFQQRSSEDRFLLNLPILGVCAIMVFWSNITDGFFVLWNYFSLTNQMIAVMCLAVSLCYMRAKKKPVIFILGPLAFLSYVVFLYLFWISPEHIVSAPEGFGLSYPVSCAISLICTFFVCRYCLRHGKHLSKLIEENKFEADSD